jgi:hypothetical protein
LGRPAIVSTVASNSKQKLFIIMNKIIYVSNPNKAIKIIAIVADENAAAMREYLIYVRKDKTDSYYCDSISSFLSDESGRIAWEAFQSTTR